jgi:hypothetical protein
MYKLHKTLYGLKHAMNALGTLIDNDFRIGKADSSLFTRKVDKDLIVCQIYVDDIIFGSTNNLFVMNLSRS